MESLQLIRFPSCQLCPKLPKLGPSYLSFRPFRQVGFGSLRRDQAEKVCLLAKRSINTDVGDDRGGYGDSGNHERLSYVEAEKGKERTVFIGPYKNLSGFDIRLSMIPYSEKTSTGNGDSHSLDENLGNGENQLLQNDQLKEIQHELNEKIKKFEEITQRSLDLLEQVAVNIPKKSSTVSKIRSPQTFEPEASSIDSKKRKRENGSDDEIGHKWMKTGNPGLKPHRPDSDSDSDWD